jgi:nitroimidazol reductase NimA-like FMN-containing flavoprotein (pyridoxamine 5'-phosphate oxidase superfamily)
MPRIAVGPKRSNLPRKGGQSAKAVSAIPRQIRGLLSRRVLGQLAYLGADGYPRVSPVWFDVNGASILISTHLGSYKAKSLRLSPRAALGVSNDTLPYQALTVICDASIEALTERRRINLLRREAHNFLGLAAGDAYIGEWLQSGHPGPGELVRLTPRRFHFYE